MKRYLSVPLLALLLSAAPIDEKSYNRAMKLIDERKWQEALALLDINKGAPGPKDDAALYWHAYVQAKMGERAKALASLDQLKQNFASSPWLNDAKLLALELQQASGQTVSPESQADEDLKLMAIQGLMHAEPERSIPLLEQILSSPKSMRLKRQALFVLSQSSSPKAQESIARIAKGNGNPDLQKLAIHNLGLSGKRNGALLEEIYKTSSAVEVKKEILQSFMIMQDKDRLLNLARTEPSEPLRSAAIQALGVAGGREQLLQLYSTETNPKFKKAILNGLFISQGSKEMVQAARSEKDIELKKAAVHYLSMMNSKEAQDFLGELLK
jgi:hypothetical protein